jgi:heme a synthase
MQQHRSNKLIARWIFVGVAMLIIQVLLGGVTRLTGSGLSITEWKPIMGALPPLNQQDWQKAFDQYQQIAQYKYLNQHFSLADFKFIFFWEWFHRLWARLIGLAFLFPFVWFLYKKHLQKHMVLPLILLFSGGALVGSLGWIMVKSGLNDTSLFVNHIKLAIHFLAAMLLIAFALVYALRLQTGQQGSVLAPRLKKLSWLITLLLILQLIYGAFMAGLKAAAAAPTWPTINGQWVPNSILHSSVSEVLVYHKIGIHFMHRGLAYVLLILLVVWFIQAQKINSSSFLNKWKKIPALLVLVQIMLGILSVLSSTKIVLGQFGWFEWFAQLHQLVGMLLFLSMAVMIDLFSTKKLA